MRKFFVMCVALIVAASSTMSQNQFSIKDIADNKFSAERLSAVTPLADGESYAMISKDGNTVEKYSYKTGKQLAVLKKPVFLVSLLAAAAVNAGMFGFYSYLSDYLGSAGFAAGAVSTLLLAYGLANIVGNTVAGRTLGSVPCKTMLAAPVILVILYLALFAAGGVAVATTALLVALGVAVGFANTTDQYMVSRAALEAPDFANGLFLTATNLGTTVGTTVCGGLISTGGTGLSVLGAVPCVVAGFAAVLARIACEKRAGADAEMESAAA